MEAVPHESLIEFRPRWYQTAPFALQRNWSGRERLRALKRVCGVHQHRYPSPQPPRGTPPSRRSTTPPTSSSVRLRWKTWRSRWRSPRGRQEARVSCGAIACQTDADRTPWRRCVGPSVPDRYVLLDPTLRRRRCGQVRMLDIVQERE